MKRVVLFILIAIFMSFNASAANKLHVVQPGDTLWALSKAHYKDPYLWGKIWMNNTYLNDPNLIFPGEIIEYTKYGITIYKGAKKISKPKQLTAQYDNFIFFDGYKYYSDCGGGFCLWRKNDLSLGKIRYDRYNEIEVKRGDTVFIYAKKNINVKKLYIYRKVKNYSQLPVNLKKSVSVLVPIGEIKIIKEVKPLIYKGIIDKAYAEVSSKDMINTIYPYKSVKEPAKQITLGNIPVELISIYSYSLTPHVGYYMFFYAKKAGIAKNIIGKRVYLERVNPNLPVNTLIGKGIVVSQYKNYLSVFFDSYNSGLTEIPDETKNYVLR